MSIEILASKLPDVMGRPTYRRLSHTVLSCICCGLAVGSALERISIDLALPGGVSFLRADGVSPA